MRRFLGRATGGLAALALVFALAGACGDDDGDGGDGNTNVNRGTGGSGGVAGAGGTGGRDAGADRGSGDGSTDADAREVGDAPPDFAIDAPQVMSEGEVLGVLDEADTGQAELGMLAGTRATTPAVLTYANLMVTDHTAAKQRLAMLSTQTGIVLASGPVRTEIQDTTTSAMTMLAAATDAPTFERAYVQSQVTMHMRLIAIIDQRLLPAATTPALRTEVMTHRAMEVTHIIMARNIQRAADAGAP
jgi:putative membrane protein